MRKVKIQELPKHQDLGIVSNKPRLGLSINPNPYANAFRPKPTALDLRKAADITTKQRLESNQNAIGQLQFDLGTTSDMSPELRAILSRQLAREQADAAGLKTDWENTQTFKDQKAEQDAIARQNWERRAYGRIEPTFGPIDAAVGLVAGLPALAATGEAWAGSALGSAVNTGIGTALQTSPSWAPGLNLGNALWSYGLASSLDRTFDPNSPMRESWRNVYNNPNLENAANALGETAYTGLGFIGANNTLRPGLKLLAEDVVQGFKAGLKPGDPSIVSMGYSLNKPAESTINLERGFRAPRKAKPSREIEEFTDQLSLIGNPNRAKDPSLDYIVSRINPGDRQGIQYKQVRFTEQGKPGDITLKVAKDDEGKPFFYFNANMENPLQAGRAFSKLDEFIPKGWSIQEPHSLSLDSWTTMMRRAKSGKFSFEDAGYLPLNRSAKNRLGNFKDYTLPENVDPMNTYFNKYYFQNPESASDYVMSLQGLIPSELKGFRPTLASEFLPGSIAKEYNYIQIPNLRLTKLLRGGDISIPNLRRVKVGGLPKAQEMGEFKPSYDFNISALENMELNRRAKAAGWNSVDEYRNANWAYNTQPRKPSKPSSLLSELTKENNSKFAVSESTNANPILPRHWTDEAGKQRSASEIKAVEADWEKARKEEIQRDKYLEDRQNFTPDKVDWYESFNPYNWGVNDYSNYSSFNSAFRNAREAGEKEFMFKGERYNTDLVDSKHSDDYWDQKNFLREYYKNEPFKPLASYDSSMFAKDLIKDKYGITWSEYYNKTLPEATNLAYNNKRYREIRDSLEMLSEYGYKQDPAKRQELNRYIQSNLGNNELINLEEPYYFSMTNNPIVGKDGTTLGFVDPRNKKLFVSTDRDGNFNTTYVHELSHKGDLGDVNYRTPQLDYEILNRFNNGRLDQGMVDYLADPSEIEARKMSTLYYFKKNGLPYQTGKITPKQVSDLSLDIISHPEKYPHDVVQLFQLFSGQTEKLVKYFNNDFSKKKGGDISIPDLRRVKISQLPKHQDTGVVSGKPYAYTANSVGAPNQWVTLPDFSENSMYQVNLKNTNNKQAIDGYVKNQNGQLLSTFPMENVAWEMPEVTVQAKRYTPEEAQRARQAYLQTPEGREEERQRLMQEFVDQQNANKSSLQAAMGNLSLDNPATRDAARNYADYKLGISSPMWGTDKLLTGRNEPTTRDFYRPHEATTSFGIPAAIASAISLGAGAPVIAEGVGAANNFLKPFANALNNSLNTRLLPNPGIWGTGGQQLLYNLATPANALKGWGIYDLTHDYAPNAVSDIKHYTETGNPEDLKSAGYNAMKGILESGSHIGPIVHEVQAVKRPVSFLDDLRKAEKAAAAQNEADLATYGFKTIRNSLNLVKKQGGAVKRVKIKSLPKNWKTK